MFSIIREIAFSLNRIRLNLRHNGVQCKSKSRIYPNTVLGGNNVIGYNSILRGSLGKYSYIGDNSQISVECGNFCSIGGGVRTLSGRHPSSIFVSTHPAFYSVNAQCGKTFVTEQKFTEHKYYDESRKIVCKIGNDVWIGERAMIMGGVFIGDGAIVAAGAIVTHDVEPYTIVAGIPAKVIAKRFSDEQTEALLASKWWNNEDSWFSDHVDMFNDIEKFIAFIEKRN